MSWSQLPTELKLMVLGYLEDSKCRQYQDPKKRKAQPHPQSAYASVCREWQQHFEPSNFRRLILGQLDLSSFERIIEKHDRKQHLEWIWLRVELLQYSCVKCDTIESQVEMEWHSKIFTDAVWRLFRCLSIIDAEHHRGIALELSVHSPSDADHYFTNLQGRINDTWWSCRTLETSATSMMEGAHGREEGAVDRDELSDEAKSRVFGHPDGLGFTTKARQAITYGELANVRAIKAFAIRRQFYRHFSVREALLPILHKLPELTDLNYECYEGHNMERVPGRAIRDQQYRSLLRDAFKAKNQLKRVSICLFRDPSHGRESMVELSRTSDPAMGRDLAVSSGGFEQLHVGNMIDAKDFFSEFSDSQGIPPTGIRWENLRSLSLSSKVAPSEFDSLIRAAGLAAQRMPKLQMMELWISETIHRAIFRYEVRDRKPIIRLSGTWGGRMSRETERSWRDVVDKVVGPADLEVDEEREIYELEEDETMISHLVLAEKLLANTTRQQLLEQR